MTDFAYALIVVVATATVPAPPSATLLGFHDAGACETAKHAIVAGISAIPSPIPGVGIYVRCVDITTLPERPASPDVPVPTPRPKIEKDA